MFGSALDKPRAISQSSAGVGFLDSSVPESLVVSYALVEAALTDWPTASCVELRELVKSRGSKVPLKVVGGASSMSTFGWSWAKKHSRAANSGWSLPKPLLCPPARAAALLLLCCRAPVCCVCCGQWPLAVEHRKRRPSAEWPASCWPASAMLADSPFSALEFHFCAALQGGRAAAWALDQNLGFEGGGMMMMSDPPSSAGREKHKKRRQSSETATFRWA